MTSEDAKLPIYKIDVDGDPVEPIENRRKYISQAGVIVRDEVPISIAEWLKPAGVAEDDPCYVHQHYKDFCFDTLLQHFNLPDGIEPALKLKLKHWTLSKMADAFRKYKQTLWAKYEKVDPDFSQKKLVKLRDHWEAFKAYKTSAAAVARSEKNKLNAASKTHHHNLGPGGYRLAIPKWLAMEDKLVAAGFTPQTYSWPERSKFWLFAHGATLNEEGKIVPRVEKYKATVVAMVPKIEDAIKEVLAGTWEPYREEDELARALGKPEHWGRLRGLPGGTTLKKQYPQHADTYRSRARKKKQGEERIANLERQMKQLINERQVQQPQDPEVVDARSQLRSSVGSTQLELDARYPVDDITEPTPCELHTPVSNISMKVAVGYALPIVDTASYHNGVIHPGYAVVGVDEIVPGSESLALEIPGGNGEEALCDVNGGFVQWNKKYIKFSKPPTQQSPPCRGIDETHPSPAPRDRDPTPENNLEDHLSQQSPSPSPSPVRNPPPEVSVPLKRRRRASSPVKRRPAKRATTPDLRQPWQKTLDQNEAAIEEHNKSLFAPKVPPPTFTEGYTAAACHKVIDNLYVPPEKPPSDYVRSIQKSYDEVTAAEAPKKGEQDAESVPPPAANEKQAAPSVPPAKEATKAAPSVPPPPKIGKQVPQLGEQPVRSVPPLIVPPPTNKDSRVPQRGKQLVQSNPKAPMVFDLEEIRRLAAEAQMPIDEYASRLNFETAPPAPPVRNFVPGKALVQIRGLPTKMRTLHQWYMKNAKKTSAIVLKCREDDEHFLEDYNHTVTFSELFQLYNLRALDKSIMSSYCL
jgi:hypothetical protein